MNKVINTFLHSLIPLVCLILPSNSFSQTEMRTWTDRGGVQVEGKLISVQQDHIELEIDRRRFTVSIADLSQTDQDFIRSYREDAEALTEEEADLEERLERSLLRNSDLNSRGGWRGAGLIEQIREEDGSMVPALEVQMHRRRILNVEQPFRVPSDLRVAELKIRYYLSEDFKSYRSSRPITLRFAYGRRGGSTYTARPLNAEPGQWGEVSWVFTQLHRNDNLTLKIEVHPGEGSLYFSEIFLDPVVD